MKVPIYKAKTTGRGIALGYFCIGDIDHIGPSIMGYILLDDMNEFLWDIYSRWDIQLDTLTFVKEVDVATGEAADFGDISIKEIRNGLIRNFKKAH